MAKNQAIKYQNISIKKKKKKNGYQQSEEMKAKISQ